LILGAAPGVGPYQFVKKGIHLFAIDNGPMQKELHVYRTGGAREGGWVLSMSQRLYGDLVGPR